MSENTIEDILEMASKPGHCLMARDASVLTRALRSRKYTEPLPVGIDVRYSEFLDDESVYAVNVALMENPTWGANCALGRAATHEDPNGKETP